MEVIHGSRTLNASNVDFLPIDKTLHSFPLNINKPPIAHLKSDLEKVDCHYYYFDDMLKIDCQNGLCSCINQSVQSCAFGVEEQMTISVHVFLST